MDQHVDQMISHYSETVLGRSGYRSEGFAAVYDTHRPAPPGELLDVLSLLARTERPRLVVDLGSGTGLSTRVWADRAETVVGVEPTAEMRAQAEAQTDAANVRYLGAWAGATGLADASADIVTCSQSLHWMEPEPTFAEAARILRPGGVFAAYDYDWPPVVDWELETAFRAMMEAVGRFRVERSHPRSRFRKEDHLARMNASGRFRYTREIVVHSAEEGSTDRLVGCAHSLGSLIVLLKEGVGEDEIGLAKLSELAAHRLGDRSVTWYMCYRARVGVR